MVSPVFGFFSGKGRPQDGPYGYAVSFGFPRRGGTVRRPFFLRSSPTAVCPSSVSPSGLPPSPQGEGFGAAIVLPVIATPVLPVIARLRSSRGNLPVRSTQSVHPNPFPRGKRGFPGNRGIAAPVCALVRDDLFSYGDRRTSVRIGSR